MKRCDPCRVVLDTNVYVAAAFNPQSAAADVVCAVLGGRLRLVWDEPTAHEIRLILGRIPPISWERFAGLFDAEKRFAGIVDPAWFGNVEDPDDRKFAALAYAADATLITQDDHLLRCRSGVGIRVVTPREFVAQHAVLRGDGA